jgi:4-hydroxy-2-oxoheptanedioate aldolase
MDAESALRRAAQGMQFLAIGSDLRMMVTEAMAILDRVAPNRSVRQVARY